MIDAELRGQIEDIVGKELRGKLNETILLILLIKNYEAAQESKKARGFGFRGRRTKRVITEGLTTRVIADELQIPQSTVATAVSRLAKRGYVTHSKGMPVKTTPQGREAANEKLMHHRLLEVHFANSLGLTPDEAHDEAVKLMLLVSCKMVDLIAKKYGNPSTCPCGEKIPESTICKI